MRQEISQPAQLQDANSCVQDARQERHLIHPLASDTQLLLQSHAYARYCEPQLLLRLSYAITRPRHNTTRHQQAPKAFVVHTQVNRESIEPALGDRGSQYLFYLLMWLVHHLDGSVVVHILCMLVSGIIGVVLDGHINDIGDARAQQQRCDCHRSNRLHHIWTHRIGSDFTNMHVLYIAQCKNKQALEADTQAITKK